MVNHDLVIITDTRWHITHCNPAACQRFQSSLVGGHIHVLAPWFAGLSLAEIEAALRETGSWQGEFSGEDDVVTEITITTLSSSPTVAEQILIVGRDITERKRFEMELEQARDQALKVSHMKTEFLGTISHELLTPMNGIIGMTDLLLTTQLSDDQVEFASTIYNETHHLLHTIKNILDFTKIEAGKVILENDYFDPVVVVENVAAIYATEVSARGLRLRTEIAEPLPQRISGDYNRVRQILSNLVSNAIKFTEKGEIVIRMRMNDHVCFSVTDTGIGIAEGMHDRVFQPFTQVDGSNTRKYGGTGLGLAISRGLVNLMSGEIGVVSEPGQGSTFWFTLNFVNAV
jgi:two-component system, sensor histidine kinase and response regulator